MIPKKHIPNALTILRLILAPIVLILFCLLDSRYSAIVGVFFILCCITDFLDGYLARKWKVESSFGKTFDPVADKVLLVGLLILMLWKGSVIGFVAVILVCRDILMDLIRIALYKKKKIIPAIKTAKIKTVLQMIGVGVALFIVRSRLGFFPSEGMVYLEQLPLIGAMIFSLWSFGVYVHKLRGK